MNLIRIDKLFNFEKGSLQSSKCVAGDYNFITASAQWKTHNEYTYEAEALVFAAAASGSLGRTHYVKGKFIASDLCFVLSPKDPTNLPVDLQFYHIIFNSLRGDIVKNTKSGTSKEAIGLASFGKYEIPYIPIDRQIEIKNQIVTSVEVKENLASKLTSQLDLIKKLRQQILQNAVQGKLVLQDPKDEPASKLIERIKEAREQLIREKKIKIEKPIPEIKPEEIPFEIPKGWVWRRFGEVVKMSRGRFSIRPRNDPRYFNGEYPFIQIGSLDERGSIIFDASQTLNEKGMKVSKLFPKGTILIAIVGGTIGNLGVLGRDMYFPDSIVGIFPTTYCNQEYILNFLRYKQPEIKSESYQMAGQPNIKIPTLTNLLFALPPLNEQHRIVTKIEQLMKLCDELEQSIQHNQKLTQELLQVALKEALEPTHVE
jgi:type I restriction enzyme S subunit